jgi:hypothetical protein
MILDVGLDSLGGTIGSFRKELNYIKWFHEEWKWYEW